MTHDRQRTHEILALVTATYPNLVLTRATIYAWHELLDDLPTDVLHRATVAVLRRQKGAWWPTPGAIREEAGFLMEQTPPLDQAWGQVRRAVADFGYMRPDQALASLHPTVGRVAQAIGWQDICQAELGIIRGQFLRLYQSALDDPHANPPPSDAVAGLGIASWMPREVP